MPSRFYVHYVSKSRRSSSGHRTGKGQSSSQFPRRVVTKECAIHRMIDLISHVSKVVLKIMNAKLQRYANQELPDAQPGFRKGRGTKDQIVNIRWITEKAGEFQKNIYLCFIDYVAKPLTAWIIINCGKLLKRWGYQNILPVSWKPCMQAKKRQSETCMEQLIGSRLRKK